MAARNYVVLFAAAMLFACIVLMRRRKVPRPRWLRRLLTATASVLIVVLTAEAVLFPGLPGIPPTGEYPIASVTLQMDDMSRVETYRDNGSCRKLSVVVYYPGGNTLAPRSCPLVVFSHGGISEKNSNVSLFRELASHGYVVASIDHTYQSLYTTIDGKQVWIDGGYLRELQTEDSHADIANSFACYQKWMAVRTADIDFVLDSFLEKSEEEDSGFYSLIDSTRLAVMGHSLGGAAALGVARQRSDIGAVVALESPYLCDITGYDGDDFTWNTAPYDCAILNIYGDSGYPLIGSDNKYVQNQNYLVNEGEAKYCYIEGANHYTLTDLVRAAPILCTLLGGGYSTPGEESLKIINESCLQFLDKYL